MKINKNIEHLPQESEKWSIKALYDKSSGLSDTLSWKENDELLYKELMTLLNQEKFDIINEYAKNNEWLRTSMHEAGHVLMGRLFNQPIVEVKIWNNEVVKMWLRWTATWTTDRWFRGGLNSQQFIQVSLAGWVAELILWISGSELFLHVSWDLTDIVNSCPYSTFLYENSYKPTWFNKNWYFTYSKSEKVDVKESEKVDVKEIEKGIMSLATNEIPNVLEVLKKNMFDLYKLWIELFWRKTLNQEDVDNILWKTL